jgi:hypothetical protein
MDVNPAMIVLRTLTVPRIAPNESTSRTAASSPAGSPNVRPMTCVCASMNPGRSVALPRSMVRAPAGTLTAPAAPTATMLIVGHDDDAILESARRRCRQSPGRP